MAKALFGHLGGPDPIVTAELNRLRRRVADLESELERLHTAQGVFNALDHDDLVIVTDSDIAELSPALT